MGIQRKKILRRRAGQVKMPHAGVHLAYLKRAKNSVWLGKDCKCERKRRCWRAARKRFWREMRSIVDQWLCKLSIYFRITIVYIKGIQHDLIYTESS